MNKDADRPEPLSLPVDPRVAVCGYRYASESEPGTFHDCALLVGSAPECDCCEGYAPCRNAPAPAPAWACDCRGFVRYDRCWHVLDAKRRYSERQRINSREAQ